MPVIQASRRRFLQSAGAFPLAAAFQVTPALAATGADITGHLARYMVASRQAPLPEDVVVACKHRILDTLGAMISGARLRPGELATAYVKSLGGTPQSSVVASNLMTSVDRAAFANAMFAHSDETDDFEPVTKAHPGSAAVPAAIAMAEKNAAGGMALIRAVTLGYDVGCRLIMALGPDEVRGNHRSAEGYSSTFCALGAGAALTNFDERRMRHAISYAAQQVSGLWSWIDDEDHVEKAFDFSGMGVRNGIFAVTMVESGLTGVDDVLDGQHNLFAALSSRPQPQEMIAELGSRFYVSRSAIKKFSVGYPNQSVLDALLSLREQHSLHPEAIDSVLVRLPTDAAGIVGASAMPDVSAPHLAALALVRGEVSFKDSHDASLMDDAAISALRSRVQVVGEDGLMDPAAPRQAIVEIKTADGRRLTHHTRFPPGTMENPMSAGAVEAKVRSLIAPVIGTDSADRLIDSVNRLEQLDDVRKLRPLWTV